MADIDVSHSSSSKRLRRRQLKSEFSSVQHNVNISNIAEILVANDQSNF